MASANSGRRQRCAVVAVCHLPAEREEVIRAAQQAILARLDAICFVLPEENDPSSATTLLATLNLPLPYCLGSTEGTGGELTRETLNEIYSLCGTTSTVPLGNENVALAAIEQAIKADVVRAANAENQSPLAISLPNDPADAPLFAARLRYLRSTTAPVILLTEWDKIAFAKDSHWLSLIEECARSTWAPPPAETNDAALGQLLQEVGRLCASQQQTEFSTATLPFGGRKRWLHSLSNVIRLSATLHGPVQKLYHRYRALTAPLNADDTTSLPLKPTFEVDRRSNATRVAVVVHAFYADLLGDLERTLRHFTEPFDLYVTTPNRSDVPLIERTLSAVTPHIVIATSENRGRDIGPFLALYRTGAFAPYKAVLKLHLKKSLYSRKGDVWRNALYDQLCPDGATIQRAIQLLESGKVGIIGPHSFFLSHPKFWGANRALVRAIRKATGHPNAESEKLGFFAGSMFWFAPDALRDVHELPEPLLSFEPEAGHQDGTLAHAFERSIADMAQHAGYSTTSLELNGEEIRERAELGGNTVPVM